MAATTAAPAAAAPAPSTIAAWEATDDVYRSLAATHRHAADAAAATTEGVARIYAVDAITTAAAARERAGRVQALADAAVDAALHHGDAATLSQLTASAHAATTLGNRYAAAAERAAVAALAAALAR